MQKTISIYDAASIRYLNCILQVIYDAASIQNLNCILLAIYDAESVTE